MTDIRVKKHTRRSEYLRAWPSLIPVPGRPMGPRPMGPPERRGQRQVRAVETQSAPEMKQLIKEQKVEIHKAKQNLKEAKVERDQIISQTKADIEKATAAVREAKIDLKDVKFAKKQIKQGTRALVLKASAPTTSQ